MRNDEPYTYGQKQRIARAKLKRQRRQQRALECSRQAMRAKAELIDQGKGKNGRSMSPELLERHAAA